MPTVRPFSALVIACAAAGAGCSSSSLGLADVASSRIMAARGEAAVTVAIVPATEACPPLDEQIVVTWNGAELTASARGGEYVEVRAPNGLLTQVCVGYVWGGPEGFAAQPSSTALKFTDGETVLRAEFVVPAERIVETWPESGVISSAQPSIEFRVSRQDVHFTAARCQGPWRNSDSTLSVVPPSPSQLESRYRLDLAQAAKPPIPPGSYRCTLLAFANVEGAVCPGSACFMAWWGEIPSADAPATDLVLELSVQ